MGGIKKTVGKQTSWDDILGIDELLDVPMFIPSIKPTVKKSAVKYDWNNSSADITPNKLFTDEDVQKESIKQLADKIDIGKGNASLASRTAKDVSSKEIYQGLKSGVISWDQINFNRDAFSYLQKNIHMIDDTEEKTDEIFQIAESNE